MSAEIEEEKIRELAIEGATDEEIGVLYGISPAEVVQRFGKLLKESRAERKVLLRKLQNEAAKKGNAGILSLLGKNELGQNGKQRTGVYRWPEPQLDPKVG
jgi:hypothetical protein